MMFYPKFLFLSTLIAVSFAAPVEEISSNDEQFAKVNSVDTLPETPDIDQYLSSSPELGYYITCSALEGGKTITKICSLEEEASRGDYPIALACQSSWDPDRGLLYQGCFSHQTHYIKEACTVNGCGSNWRLGSVHFCCCITTNCNANYFIRKDVEDQQEEDSEVDDDDKKLAEELTKKKPRRSRPANLPKSMGPGKTNVTNEIKTGGSSKNELKKGARTTSNSKADVVKPDIKKYLGHTDKIEELIVATLNCEPLKENAVEQEIINLLKQVYPMPDIIALSEIRMNEFGKSVSVGETNYFLFSRSVESRRTGIRFGTGFLTKEELGKCVLCFKPESDRLSYMDMILDKQPFRIIAVCLPEPSESNFVSIPAYRHLLNRIQLIIPENQLSVIAGNWKSEIRCEEDLTNLSLDRECTWTEHRLMDFCQINRLHVFSFNTKVTQDQYSQIDSGILERNHNDTDYIMCAEEYAAETKSDVNSSMANHLLKSATFSLLTPAKKKPCNRLFDSGMELFFVLEWAVVTQSPFICVGFQIDDDAAQKFLDKWGKILTGINIGAVNVSLYHCSPLVIVVSQSVQEMNQLLWDGMLKGVLVKYIATRGIVLHQRAKKMSSMKLFGRIGTLDSEDFEKETEDLMKEKLHHLPKSNLAVKCIVQQMLAKCNSMKFVTPFFERMSYIRHVWLELLTEKKCWTRR